MAYAGVKSLVLPRDIAIRILSRLQECLGDQGKSIHKEYRELLDRQITSEELIEEYDHFQCLVHSKAASLFHLRNILVRLAFSAHTKNAIEARSSKSKKIIERVIHYYRDYMLFYQEAYGPVEAHHIIEHGVSEEDLQSRVIYRDRIRSALDELKGIQQRRRPPSKLNSVVAEMIDHRYALRLGMRSTVSSHNSEGNVARTLRLAAKLLTRDLLVPAAWPGLVRLTIINYQALWPYLRGRFKSQKKESHGTGNLPGILAADVTIDPVGFTKAKLALSGQDGPGNSLRDTILKNMLWHIISRVVVCAGLMESGVDKGAVITYFKMLRKFNLQWSPRSEGADLEIANIDNSVVVRLFKLRHGDGYRSSVDELQDVALDLYLHWKAIPTIDLDSDTSAHMYAFNCSYMHV